MARHKIQQKIDANGTVVDLDIEAERASKDGNGDVIANTYVKDVKIGNTSVVNSSRVAQFEELTNAEIDEICSGAGSNPSGLDTMLLNKLYPVGSIYTSVNNVSPASFLGGNWERISGRFLLGASEGTTEENLSGLGYSRSGNGYWYYLDASGNRIGITPGKAYYQEIYGTVGHNHTLENARACFTLNDADGKIHMDLQTQPSNNWVTNRKYTINSGWSNPGSGNTNTLGTVMNGTTDAQLNMPPYQIVYMWKRLPD